METSFGHSIVCTVCIGVVHCTVVSRTVNALHCTGHLCFVSYSILIVAYGVGGSVSWADLVKAL